MVPFPRLNERLAWAGRSKAVHKGSLMDSLRKLELAVVSVGVCGELGAASIFGIAHFRARRWQAKGIYSSTYQTSTDIHTHRSSNPTSTATAFLISPRPKHLFLVVSLLLLKRLAQRRWLYPVVTIMPLDPLSLRVRRWNTLIRNSSSEIAAITGLWGNRCKMLVEADHSCRTGYVNKRTMGSTRRALQDSLSSYIGLARNRYPTCGYHHRDWQYTNQLQRRP